MNENLVSQILEDMIHYSKGNLHDIAHFMKVYSFARTIAVEEGLKDDLLFSIEITAILHDISCPLCRIKYGNTNGKHQEEESGPLVKDFLKDYPIEEKTKERINYIISHHHTITNVDGIDYQIILEADFLVNADESHMNREQIMNAEEQFFKTETGKRILESMYLAQE